MTKSSSEPNVCASSSRADLFFLPRITVNSPTLSFYKMQRLTRGFAPDSAAFLTGTAGNNAPFSPPFSAGNIKRSPSPILPFILWSSLSHATFPPPLLPFRKIRAFRRTLPPSPPFLSSTAKTVFCAIPTPPTVISAN